MKIAVMGSRMVGDSIATKLTQLGHMVMMGSRTAANERALAWKAKAGANASTGTFADAARHGEIVFNATAGMASIEALKLSGADNLKGKILIDVANPLDFSKGMPPSLSVCNTDSLGEQIQRTFPDARVVKTLNTVTTAIMVDPSLVPGDHDMFMCGNDDQAKATVEEILRSWFGWKIVTDLGDITNARAMEMVLPLWVRLFQQLGTPNFNFHIVK